MDTITALYLLRQGYNVADETMVDLGTYLTIESVESETLSYNEFIMHDPVEQISERFYFTSELLLDPEMEWYLVYTDKLSVNHYLKINADVDDDGIVSDVANRVMREAAKQYDGAGEEKKDCGDSCKCNKSKEDPEEILKKLQTKFYSLTMSILLEKDYKKKMDMYDELIKISAEMEKISKENR